MKALSVSELDNIIGSLRALIGARLQEVRASADDLVLGFYSAGEMLWLWIDLHSIRPILLPWSELPLTLSQKKSPLILFLRAHFDGRVLQSVERDTEQGKVVRFHFSGEDTTMEVRLIPHARNVLLNANGKKIAWQKPKPVEAYVEEKAPLRRSLNELREEWFSVRGGGRAKQDPKQRLQSEITKKEKALAKVKDELARKQALPWRQIGDALKSQQSLDVRDEWEPFIDRRRKLSWNIETCYQKARENEAKITGTQQRIALLENEIIHLKAQLAGNVPLAPAPDQRRPQVLKEVGAQGRTLRLTDEIHAVTGKNAADNLKLLRRAHAWDLWLHLRDEPSRHAILFRNKHTKISDKVLHEVSAWLVKTHFGAKYAQHAGEKVAVIVAECRHVRPIKGDKIGRVTYRDERILIHVIPDLTASSR